MKKIPCVFQRDFTDKRNPKTLDAVTPGCEWVLAGEGVATRKWDGTACLFRDGKLYKRYDAKHGKQPPSGFEGADDPDPVTGHWPGWLPVDLLNPDSGDVWHALAYWQAFATNQGALPAGSYELIGPKINGNAEHWSKHEFVEHGDERVPLQIRTFAGIRNYLIGEDIEGIVFWRESDNPNCDKAKIRRVDFGLQWPVPRTVP